jgi:hypothetical protein
MQNEAYLIVDIFNLTDRGIVVVLHEHLSLTGGKSYQVKIEQLDGGRFGAIAFLEQFLEQDSNSVKKTALLLQHNEHAVTVGSTLRFE